MDLSLQNAGHRQDLDVQNPPPLPPSTQEYSQPACASASRNASNCTSSRRSHPLASPIPGLTAPITVEGTGGLAREAARAGDDVSIDDNASQFTPSPNTPPSHSDRPAPIGSVAGNVNMPVGNASQLAGDGHEPSNANQSDGRVAPRIVSFSIYRCR